MTSFSAFKTPYFLLGFVFLFSCKKERLDPPPNYPTFIKCPDSKLKGTHLIQMRGLFTSKAQTIVPEGEKPFPIELNKEDVKKLNAGTKEILCRVLERRGIGAGNIVIPTKEHAKLPNMIILIGPGLKLKTGKTEFLMPPAEKGAELLTNFEHSLDRLFEATQK